MTQHRIGMVTGAARGIGKAIADELAPLCDKLILLDIDEDWANQPVKGNTSRFLCDVGNADAVREVLSKCTQAATTPNIIINNVGRGGPFHRVDEVSDDEWYELFDTNVKSVFNVARGVLPSMKAQGFGRIVNIASIQGYLGAARSSTYVAGKHAVIGYTRAIAAEWGAFGITCNAICPGYVATAQGTQDGVVDDHTRRVIGRTPTGRIAAPEEVAKLAAFIVSEGASFINGSTLTIDGGLSSDVGVS